MNPPLAERLFGRIDKPLLYFFDFMTVLGFDYKLVNSHKYGHNFRFCQISKGSESRSLSVFN